MLEMVGSTLIIDKGQQEILEEKQSKYLTKEVVKSPISFTPLKNPLTDSLNGRIPLSVTQTLGAFNVSPESTADVYSADIEVVKEIKNSFNYDFKISNVGMKLGNFIGQGSNQKAYDINLTKWDWKSIAKLANIDKWVFKCQRLEANNCETVIRSAANMHCFAQKILASWISNELARISIYKYVRSVSINHIFPIRLQRVSPHGRELIPTMGSIEMKHPDGGNFIKLFSNHGFGALEKESYERETYVASALMHYSYLISKRR